MHASKKMSFQIAIGRHHSYYLLLRTFQFQFAVFLLFENGHIAAWHVKCALAEYGAMLVNKLCSFSDNLSTGLVDPAPLWCATVVTGNCCRQYVDGLHYIY